MQLLTRCRLYQTPLLELVTIMLVPVLANAVSVEPNVAAPNTSPKSLDGWTFVAGWMPDGATSLAFEPVPARSVEDLVAVADQYPTTHSGQRCFAFSPNGAFYGNFSPDTKWRQVPGAALYYRSALQRASLGTGTMSLDAGESNFNSAVRSLETMLGVRTQVMRLIDIVFCAVPQY